MKKVARLKSLFNKGFSPFFFQSKKTLIFFKKSVDICFKVLYNNLRCQATTTQYGSLAQLAEHLTFNQGVPSSNLVSRSIHSSIAQSVEQSAVNRSVVGSSPTRGAILTH